MTATDSYADIADAPECVSLREGQRVFERYVLVEMAGRGCRGMLWKARDKTLDRIVALKFLPDRLYRDAAARDELKQETRRCLELAHPNIVRIHDFLEDGDMAAIAMEYVDGLNLSELRMERPSRCFKPEELSVWVTELCAVIDYAHETGRCLRHKLKPDSLMVNSVGALKITDFGFVFGTRGHVEAGANHDATLGYMSPQQVMGEPPSPSDDIYAVGATLYELLTGKPPFDGDDLSTQIREVIPESMAQRRRNSGRPESALPPAWEDAIAACLAKEPSRRPASGKEMACLLGLAVQPPAEATVLAARAFSFAEISASIAKWLKDPRLASALSRVAGQVRTGMAQLKRTRLDPAQWRRVPWKQYRPIIISAAILCAPLAIFFAIRPWLVKKHSPSAEPVAVVAPAGAPTLAVAPIPAAAAASAAASVPAVVSAPAAALVPAPASTAPIVPAAPPVAVTAATPVVAPPAPPSPASAEAPAIPNAPPQTADQRALTEPIPTPEAGAQVRIETVPPGIPFQVMSDSPDASAHLEAQSSGVSPATLILPQGAYRIVYSLPGQAPRMTSVKVPAAGSALFQQEFPHGVVKVSCQPERAEVICDGRAVGAAPLDLLLPPGRHEIGARWNGHQARTRTVELAAAGEQALAFEFHASSSSARSHHSKKKPDDSLFAKIGRGFKNLFER
jgi:hypothetical protein